MLFWLFIIILLVGIGIYIWYDNFYDHYKGWIEVLYNALNAVGVIAIVISIIFISINYISVDADVSKKEQTYQSLVYQYENAVLDWDDDVVGKKELYDQIEEWNTDLAWHKSAQKDFWIGVYIPNVYDQFEFIELTTQNDRGVYMICPKCNKKMIIMYRPDATLLQDGTEHTEVLGRCENCDFDATWEIVTDIGGHVEEFNLKRYFFG